MTIINPQTLQFLTNLSLNNNRDWFLANKAHYETALQNVLAVADAVLAQLKIIDKSIPETLTAKKSVMRIYRDVRFSKNKEPYKNNFGIGFSAIGKNSNYPGYYIHIQPNQSFIAGGYWMPEAQHLKAIRQEIDYNTSQFKAIIENQDFVNCFGSLSQSDKLKTCPKGYSADNENIELLKLKSFTVFHSFTNNEITNNTIITQITNCLSLIYPFTNFLKNAIQ
ncbi:MAG: DUF2461 domain-containing protein [Sphingobacteriales bacterium]|nr:MAG: DUF2461 domain-containing protein [Sphingobacteriales bacterium]TAF78569.1 MAG: DUF2461 domain-containing protein [Sphingobacteriales bacterium]